VNFARYPRRARNAFETNHVPAKRNSILPITVVVRDMFTSLSPSDLADDLGRGVGRGWLRPAVALVAIGWGANQFAPLIVLYQQHGLSAAATAAMFGLYAVGLIPALLVGGGWSDRVGRHVVLVAALVLSLVATVVLMAGSAWHWLLFPGRLIAGISSGLAFGTGAAWIKELSRLEAHPHTGPRRATIAMTIGFGGGPLVAGLIAQNASRPELWPYVPQIVLALLALLAVTRSGNDSLVALTDAPEFQGPSGHERSLWRHLLLVSTPFGPWVFGTAAIALAYLPGLVATRAGSQPLTFAAVATAIPAIAGVIVQPVIARLGRRTGIGLLVQAMAVAVLALIGAAWAASAGTVWAVLAAAAALGAAYGMTQFAGLADIQHIAEPSRLGVATSAYQAVSYLGFTLPYLLTLGHIYFGWSPVAGLCVVLMLAVGSLAWLALGAVRAANTQAR
jgi:MFS family permease